MNISWKNANGDYKNDGLYESVPPSVVQRTGTASSVTPSILTSSASPETTAAVVQTKKPFIVYFTTAIPQDKVLANGKREKAKLSSLQRKAKRIEDAVFNTDDYELKMTLLQFDCYKITVADGEKTSKFAPRILVCLPDGTIFKDMATATNKSLRSTLVAALNKVGEDVNPKLREGQGLAKDWIDLNIKRQKAEDEYNPKLRKIPEDRRDKLPKSLIKDREEIAKMNKDMGEIAAKIKAIKIEPKKVEQPDKEPEAKPESKPAEKPEK